AAGAAPAAAPPGAPAAGDAAKKKAAAPDPEKEPVKAHVNKALIKATTKATGSDAAATESLRRKSLRFLFEQEEETSKIDMGVYAGEIAKLIKNYTSLVDIKKNVITQAEEYLDDEFPKESETLKTTQGLPYIIGASRVTTGFICSRSEKRRRRSCVSR
ncbi:hypothetical protein EBZ37_13835, partial [bacterium]|nr:hypothetical protein [bacterium]